MNKEENKSKENEVLHLLKYYLHQDPKLIFFLSWFLYDNLDENIYKMKEWYISARWNLLYEIKIVFHTF